MELMTSTVMMILQSRFPVWYMIQSLVLISGREMPEAAVSLAERTRTSYLAAWLKWKSGEVDMCLAMLSEAVARRMGGGGVVFWSISVVEMRHPCWWVSGLC